jgi:hypothetical protein
LRDRSIFRSSAHGSLQAGARLYLYLFRAEIGSLLSNTRPSNLAAPAGLISIDVAGFTYDKHASSSWVDFRYNGVPVYRCSAYISVPYTQVKKACLAALPRISVKMLWLLAAAWYSGLIREDWIIVSANGAGGRLGGKLRNIRSAQGVSLRVAVNTNAFVKSVKSRLAMLTSPPTIVTPMTGPTSSPPP